MLFNLALWATVGLLLGLLLVILLPWVTARMIGVDAVEKVSDWYVWLAQSCVRKSALVPRPGTIDLVAKRYDSDQKADKDKAGSEPRHHYDNFSGVRSLANKPFGIAPYNLDEYVTPLLAEISDRANELREREELGSQHNPDGSTEMQDGIGIDAQSKLVDISSAVYAATGDADPESGHRAFKKTVISQERFHEKLTFGQTITAIGAFVVSAVVMWLLASQSAPSAGSTVTGLAVLAAPLSLFKQINWHKIGVLTGALVAALIIPLIALFVHGFLAAVVTLGVAALVAGGYVAGIALFGPSLPIALGQPLAMVNWTLAQLAVGRGVLVERATGQYEHHQLREAPDNMDADYLTTLSDGSQLEVEGSPGDMFRFGWAPLGLTAEKTAENMSSVTSNPSEAATDGGVIRPNTTRQGFQPAFDPEQASKRWVVTLPQLWKWCQSSGESQAIREGRDTALTNKGGDQQISFVVFLGLIMVLMIAGGLMGLIAGGALI